VYHYSRLTDIYRHRIRWHGAQLPSWFQSAKQPLRQSLTLQILQAKRVCGTRLPSGIPRLLRWTAPRPGAPITWMVELSFALSAQSLHSPNLRYSAGTPLAGLLVMIAFGSLPMLTPWWSDGSPMSAAGGALWILADVDPPVV